MKHDTQTPKQAAYAAIRRGILLMEIAPGTPLDEADLCQRHGISRTPFRDVVRQLAGEGYVTVIENRGAQVSDMSHRTLRDFFLAAPMVYGAILQLAAENAAPPQIARLKEAQMAFRKALADGDTGERALTNDVFHRITGEMAGNVYLSPSFHRLLIDHARIGMTFFRGQDPEAAADLDEAARQHDAMIAAIEARDTAAATDLAAAHWNLSRDQIQTFVMPTALAAPLGAPPSTLLGQT